MSQDKTDETDSRLRPSSEENPLLLLVSRSKSGVVRNWSGQPMPRATRGTPSIRSTKLRRRKAANNVL
jgi:hypothetical protein